LLLDSDDAGPTPARRTRLRRSTPYAIGELPPELKHEGASLLLFCGPDRGWRRGVPDEHGWHEPSDAGQRLEPSHFALVSGRSAGDETKRVAIVVVAVLAATLATVLGIGQVAYGDPWALCAPNRGSADASVTPK
jgi:hypothetical protein